MERRTVPLKLSQSIVSTSTMTQNIRSDPSSETKLSSLGVIQVIYLAQRMSTGIDKRLVLVKLMRPLDILRRGALARIPHNELIERHRRMKGGHLNRLFVFHSRRLVARQRRIQPVRRLRDGITQPGVDQQCGIERDISTWNVDFDLRRSPIGIRFAAHKLYDVEALGALLRDADLNACGGENVPRRHYSGAHLFEEEEGVDGPQRRGVRFLASIEANAHHPFIWIIHHVYHFAFVVYLPPLQGQAEPHRPRRCCHGFVLLRRLEVYTGNGPDARIIPPTTGVSEFELDVGLANIWADLSTTSKDAS